MLDLLKPILIFLFISTSTSLLFSNSFLGFIKYFLFFSLVQYILNRIYIHVLQLYAEKIKNERIKEYTKQGMEITCPCYLEKKFLLPIDLNKENNFSCLECSKNFTVDIKANTFLKTEVLDLDKSEEAFLSAINKIQNS